MYKGPMDKAKGGWDVGVNRAGESDGGKMETPVLEQQQKCIFKAAYFYWIYNRVSY